LSSTKDLKREGEVEGREKLGCGVLTHKRHAKGVQKSLNSGNPNKFPHV